MIVSKSPYIQSEDLPSKFRTSPDPVTSITLPIGLTMKEIEQEVIRKTLLYTKGNKQAAAKMLGISLATLYRRLG